MTLPTGHEWRISGALTVCHLCGVVMGTPAARLACAGSAAEPGSLEKEDER